ncbi:MAG: Bug family tripartite tricarboxylate transporter substrate binding protein [Burkholderiaceae bacterium]
MNLSRRSLLRGLPAAGLALTPAFTPAARAQSGNKPLRLIVPFAPGGGGDVLARFIAQQLPASLGPVIVENRPGASTLIGSREVVNAAPDGRTLLLNVPLLVQAPAMQEKPAFDPVRDLRPVSEIVTSPLWLATNAQTVPAQTLAELGPALRRPSAPGSYGSIGQGSSGHMLGHMLNETMNLNLVHVPYKGSSQCILALLAGDIGVAFLDYVTLRPHVEAGKLRVLASSGERRSTITPNVPTFAESGYPGFESQSWAGFFAPAKTPDDVVDQLHREITRVIATREAQDKFRELGYDPGRRSPTEFAALVRADQQRWSALIKRLGITLN